MKTRYCVYKDKETCTSLIGSKQFHQVVGATHRHLGMRLLGDQTETLWLRVSESMALLLVSKTSLSDINTLFKTVQVMKWK